MGLDYEVDSDTGEVRAGQAADHVSIGPDGVTLVGTARYFRQVVLTPNLLQGGGLNAPSEAVLSGIALVLVFDNNLEEEVFAVFEANPLTDTGEDILWHVLWSPSTADTGDVVWAVEFNVVRPENGELITVATSTVKVVDAAGGVVDELQSTGDVTIAGTGAQAGDLIQLRIYRDATDVLDTFTGDAQFSVSRFFVVADKLGGAV